MTTPYILPRTVTPADAKQWLKHNNARNRNIRRVRVNQYAADMANGQWANTGEPIKFGTDGKLLDGQHRLHAVVRSGASVDMFVGYDFPPSAQLFMDTGAARSPGDALGLVDENNATPLAAAAKLGYLVDNGLLAAEHGRQVRVSHPQIIGWINANPGIRHSVETTIGLTHTNVYPSVRAYAHYRYTQVDPYEAERFFYFLNTGENLSRGNVILALRNRLLTMRANKERLTQRQQLNAMFRAWNAWRSDASVHKFLIRNVNDETLPLLK